MHGCCRRSASGGVSADSRGGGIGRGAACWDRPFGGGRSQRHCSRQRDRPRAGLGLTSDAAGPRERGDKPNARDGRSGSSWAGPYHAADARATTDRGPKIAPARTFQVVCDGRPQNNRVPRYTMGGCHGTPLHAPSISCTDRIAGVDGRRPFRLRTIRSADWRQFVSAIIGLAVAALGVAGEEDPAGGQLEGLIGRALLDGAGARRRRAHGGGGFGKGRLGRSCTFLFGRYAKAHRHGYGQASVRDRRLAAHRGVRRRRPKSVLSMPGTARDTN